MNAAGLRRVWCLSRGGWALRPVDAARRAAGGAAQCISLSLGLCGALVLIAPMAWAQAPARARLAVVRERGADACPGERALVASVRARAGDALLDPESDRAVEVLFSRSAEGLRAQVTLRDGAGTSLGVRALAHDGPDCAPLADDVVLAVALAIDPDATVAPRETTVPAPSAPPVALSPVPREPRRVVVRTSEACMGLSGGVSFGSAPAVAPRVSLEAMSGRRGLLRWTLGAARTLAVSTADRAFEFSESALRLGACVGGRWQRLLGDLCGELAPSLVQATVLDTSRFEPVSPGERFALGAAIVLRGGLRLADPIELELAAAPALGLLRPRFALASGETVHEPSLFTLAAWLAVRARFE